MSRIGKEAVKIPENVEVKIDGDLVYIKGPKGSLKKSFDKNMSISCEGSFVLVKRPDDSKKSKSLHGLTRSLIFNMVEGVTKGFEKKLEVSGVGYRVQKKGESLVLNLGYSHQVVVEKEEGIEYSVEGQNLIVVSGLDKQRVGQIAAEIRSKRPPEPYKGKGVRYFGERIVLKAGKAGKGKS